MIVSALAKRYARALADVTSELGVEADVERDLDFLVQAVRLSADLENALKNPAIPQEAKLNVLKALWIQAGGALHPQMLQLVTLLIKNNRTGLIEQIQAAYRGIIEERSGVISAQVTTRFDLREGQRQRLIQRLQEFTGKRVRLSFDKDSALIGGVVLRIGSTLYDGSIRRQLEEIKMRLGSDIS